MTNIRHGEVDILWLVLHLPGDRRTNLAMMFLLCCMLVFDAFYGYFSAVTMFKISVRKLPACLGRFCLMSSWRPWAYGPWTP